MVHSTARPLDHPAQGLCHRSIHRLPGPVDAHKLAVFQEPGLPQPVEHARLAPFLEPIMGGAVGADARGIQRVPLAAGPQHKQNPLQALPVVCPWTTAAKPMRIHMCGQQRLDLGPQFVRHPTLGTIPSDSSLISFRDRLVPGRFIGRSRITLLTRFISQLNTPPNSRAMAHRLCQLSATSCGPGNVDGNSASWQ